MTSRMPLLDITHGIQDSVCLEPTSSITLVQISICNLQVIPVPFIPWMIFISWTNSTRNYLSLKLLISISILKLTNMLLQKVFYVGKEYWLQIPWLDQVNNGPKYSQEKIQEPIITNTS